MDIEKQKHILEQIPANRKLIDALYSHGKISKEGREYALNLVYPNNEWGLWISRLLLLVGISLIISGVVYFFSFNWTKIDPIVKLFSIQLGIIACMIIAYYRSLEIIIGQIALFSATVLVGVFMAVFGQIYQTGANSYQLFMIWSLLTLGWTLISNFAIQWVLWLLITNIFLIFWWLQAATYSMEMRFNIFIYLTLLNVIALIFREYFALKKDYEWLKNSWTRLILVIAILSVMIIPILLFIYYPFYSLIFVPFNSSSSLPKSIIVSSFIGIIGHGIGFYFYRYKMPDIYSLAAILVSFCIIFILFTLKFFLIYLDPFLLLLNVIVVITISYKLTYYLRKVAKKMESKNV